MSQPAGGAQSGATDPTQSGGASTQPGTNPDPNASPTGTSAPQSGQPDPSAATVSAAEYAALQARLAAADRNNAATAKKLKDIEDAKLSEAERDKQALLAAQAELAAEKERNNKQTVDNAILADTTYAGKWHDVEAAMDMVDRSTITIDDKGKPQGVKAALDKLAKDRPWLLKPETSGTESNNNGTGATGAPGTGRQQNPGTNQTDLERRFPALRGRVPTGSA
jgi:hypothetical protein